MPRLPLQNAYPGLPLLLTPEETTLLISKGIFFFPVCNSDAVSYRMIDLAVMNSATGTSESWAFPKTDLDRLRYRVFEYLWSKQLYITRGLKFGGDFMAYPGDPMRFHSHYIVLAMERDAPLALLDMISKGRLAVNVKKTFVIAGPAEQESCDDIETFSIQWAGF